MILILFLKKCKEKFKVDDNFKIDSIDFIRNFNLNIIPHTLKLTNLKNLKKNEIVNVELDIFGKYIYKYTT